MCYPVAGKISPGVGIGDPPDHDVRLCSRGSACWAVRAARMAGGKPAVLRGVRAGLSAALRFRRAASMLASNMLATNIGGGMQARRWWMLGVTCLSVVVVALDLTILNIALPSISAELHASTRDLQWIVDAYSLAFAAVMLPAGLAGDRSGPGGCCWPGWRCSAQRRCGARCRPRRGS